MIEAGSFLKRLMPNKRDFINVIIISSSQFILRRRQYKQTRARNVKSRPIKSHSISDHGAMHTDIKVKRLL